jgi:acetylornithine deacetylase/succinyl-diaminopimelate desuccinylase-like protein
MITRLLIASTLALAAAALAAQTPDWPKVDEETMRHYQALLRMDTSDPPGKELPVAEYLKQAFDKEGIPAQLFALEPNRPNVVARLKGNGKKRPILIVGHSDVVNVDPAKWTFPPFSATRDGGWVYGRGTVDDKDNLAATLMVMLELKRRNVTLDRDVIFLSEAGEEGSTRVGIQYMVDQHYPEIDAEYCFAEGGGVTRVGGTVKYAGIATLEKIPYAIELTAKGVAGHGSVPLRTNAVVHLSNAIGRVGSWKPEIRLNETTATYFRRLAAISAPADAQRYQDVLVPNSRPQADADEYFLDHEPAHASMLRTSLSPNMVGGGYRVNIIPSEAKATLDVRMLPDENPAAFLEQVRKIVDDPTIDVRFGVRDTRPPQPDARLDSEAFKVIEANVTKHYSAPTLPTMLTGATDMAYLRAKGQQCFGIGPAMDVEDGPKGFGAHSDQERLLESELFRFVRFHWDVVVDLARAR